LKDLEIHFDDTEQEARFRLWRAVEAEREIKFHESYIYRIVLSVMTTDEAAGLMGWSEPKARNIIGQKTLSTYAAEIFDSTGKRSWHGQRARKGRDYSANRTLTSRMILAGRYLIKLYGLRDEKHEPVDDCPVLINYQ